ncbi:hypothetical protein AALB81_13630 [Lachnospiraceae bacterium 48-33]
MKIYKKNDDILIEVLGRNVCINKKTYELSVCDINKDICFGLVKFLKQNKVENGNMIIEDYHAENEELILLLSMTILHNTFMYMNVSYELSFAYAVPLCKDTYLLNFTIDNLDECLKNKQIVFLQSDTLYLYKVINADGYERVCKSQRKTINKNSHTVINQVPFSDTFFNFWKEYDFWRFGENQTIEFQKFFYMVYNSNPAFKLYEYKQDGVIVAYNVCYFSQNQKVIYDVLFPWKNIESTYRVGIYSIIVNLKNAFDMGWGYSICYGVFDYKNKILDKLEEK